MEDKGIVTGKVFETLGLGRPVLLIAPYGSDATVIAESTGLGKRFAGDDIDGMALFLKDLILSGETLKAKNIDAYAWMNIIKRLDSVLLAATGITSGV
jgi:hypothetical protein